MAPAAAPPHRGLPAGRAGPRGWPDRQGAGRLASPAAAASRLGRSYGRGGSEAAPAGGRGLRGRLPRPVWPCLAQRPQRKRGGPGAGETPPPRQLPGRRPPFPAAVPASRRFLLLCLGPLPGGVRWLRPRPDSRYGRGGRRAAAAAPLIVSSPPSQPATPPCSACPSHLQRALGTDRGSASGERATLWRAQG